MWAALEDIAAEHGQTVHDLVTAINRKHDRASLTSAIRVFIVEYYRRTHR
jgi:predicted DNA-binding ribbon-helix-helix protein